MELHSKRIMTLYESRSAADTSQLLRDALNYSKSIRGRQKFFLRELMLTSEQISDVDFSDSSTGFTGGIFDGSNFNRCVFSDTTFSGSSFVRSQFVDCIFINTNLSGCDFTEATFIGCNLTRTNFVASFAIGCRFINSSMWRGVVLSLVAV